MIKLLVIIFFFTASGGQDSITKEIKTFSTKIDCAEYLSTHGFSTGMKLRGVGKEVKKLGGKVYKVEMVCK